MTRLRSVTTRPIVAAISSVAQPTTAPTSAAAGACSNSGCMRATRYTPAVTIVAAWIRAETGVGPSIASGSQVCSGTWADFANAPTSSSRQTATRSPSLRENSCTPSNARRKSSEPVRLKMKYVPSTSPTSPTTLMTNALIPAAVAVGRHVGDRVEVDQRRDARHHQRHEDRQWVEQQRQLSVDADRVRVVPRDRDDLTLLLSAVLELEQRADGAEEREEDRERAEVAVELPRQDAPGQRDQDRAAEREQQHEPAVGLQAQPCSSR